jgi:hypothetical protein
MHFCKNPILGEGILVGLVMENVRNKVYVHLGYFTAI